MLTFFSVLALISWLVVQQQIPAVDFVHKYQNVFSFKYVCIHCEEVILTVYYSQTFLKQLDDTAQKCNYAGYVEKYVTFPPKGPLPMPGKSTFADPGCDIWNEILTAVLIVNPAFNVYRIFDTYPVLWDVLGFPCVLSFMAYGVTLRLT